jgi:hypothetical protein
MQICVNYTHLSRAKMDDPLKVLALAVFLLIATSHELSLVSVRFNLKLLSFNALCVLHNIIVLIKPTVIHMQSPPPPIIYNEIERVYV